MQHLESAAVWSVMAVTYVIADLSYTTKFPKTYVWEHRGKGGTEKEGEKESRVGVGIYVINFVKSSFFSIQFSVPEGQTRRYDTL